MISPLEVSPGDYRLDLGLLVGDREYPVARSTLAVTGLRVDTSLEADRTPRVLVYVAPTPLDRAGQANRTAFVRASLQRAALIFETTSDPLEFARLFRSGTWNTYVVMAEMPVLLPLLADELREAVFRGDGLLLVQWRPHAAHDLEEALGATLQGQLPGTTHTLELPAGPLGPAQTLSIPGRAARVRPAAASVAGTMDGGTAALTVYGFGAGRSAVMAFDPAVPPGTATRAALEDLFGRVVAYTAPRQARTAAPGTVLPLAVFLTNHGSAVEPVDVAVSLPFGVRLASVDDGPLTSDPPAWHLTVPPGASRRLRFQVVAPDQSGSYTFGTRVEVGGIAVPSPPVFDLEIETNRSEDLAGVIAALEATTVDPSEHGLLQSAIALLRGAQRAEAERVLLELRVRLGAEAAETLGRVHTADLARERGEVDRLIAAWEREWCDGRSGP